MEDEIEIDEAHVAETAIGAFMAMLAFSVVKLIVCSLNK